MLFPCPTLTSEELKRYTLDSPNEGSTISVGDTVTWTDNGTLTNPNDRVNVDIVLPDGTILDQGVSTQAGTFVLTNVPSGPVQICLQEMLFDDNDQFVAAGPDRCCYDAIGEVSKEIDFGADQPVGSVSAADLEAGIGNALDYQTNVQLAEIANGGIRQVIPTNGLDPRFLFESTMPDSRCYTVTQTVLWETNPADFGGATNFQTTKVGYGLASATPLDGGQVDPSRFSIRFVQFNGEWKLYSYFAERPGTFGEYLNNGAIVPVTPGVPQTMSMTLCQNTGSQDNGTLIATVDGVVIHQDNNVVIQTSDHNITSCIYGTFFGGSGTDWAPSSPQTINIYDVSYNALP